MWKLQWSKGSKRKRRRSSFAEEVDFVDLCEKSVHNLQDLVKSEHLLNLRQCQDLSTKVSETLQNIRELYSYSGASVGVFQPALKNLYRHVLKAEALVRSCAEKEWCAAAVFQCQNENAFREILLDVSLCYSAIYVHARSAREPDWTDPPEDLRRSSIFVPTSRSAIDGDNQDLQRRLNDHANGYTNSIRFDLLNGWSGIQERFLAKYLLTRMCHKPLEPRASTLDVYSPVLWTKGLEPWRTWGSSRFLGAGSGATGVCSTEWLGIPCAKKDFHEGGQDGLFMKEAGILAHLKHPCIVSFICCGNGSAKGDRFIAMELMEKSLLDLIEEQKGVYFASNVAIDMIVQMARGVRYLHDQGVAHRDLKPQNVVVKRLGLPHVEDHYSVKLVDFGISKIKVETSQLNTMTSQGIGTTRYRAPEANPGEGGKIDWCKADVFSFAMTCAHLLTLETPLQEILVPSVLYKEVSKNGLRPKLPDWSPETLVMLLKDCWKRNPKTRPSFKEICTRLETLKYMDASVDGVVGGFRVDLEYTKEKMDEKVLEGSILVEEVEEKTYDLPLPILPCPCGSAVGAFHESPYKLVGTFYCNICGEDCHEEGYHCGSCDFDAHPSCLEVNERVEVFFHEHPLHLLIKGYHTDKLDTTCYICKESLQHSDWVYQCEQCDLDVHALCTKYPKVLMRNNVHRHPVNLIQYLPQKSLLCILCDGGVMRHSWRYTCIEKSCDYDIHPYCIAMVASYMMCVFDASHRINLVNWQRGFHCSICGSLGFSWLYHCEHCKLDGHVECLGEVKGDEENWSGACEELLQEYKTQSNHNMMHMLVQLLERIFGSDSFKGGIPSTSSMTQVARGSQRGVQPNVRRLAASETLDLGAIDFDDGDLRKRIAVETIARRAKRTAAKAGTLESKAQHLEMLKNLEKIVLDLQSAESVVQGDRAVLDRGLEKLKIRKHSVEDDMATLVQSRMRHGPRACVFYQDKYRDGTVWKLLTSVRADLKDVHVDFLCEEPGHQHLVDGCQTQVFNGVLGEERVQILQALLGRGLEVVARIVSTSAGQLTGLDRVELPVLGLGSTLDLEAIDVEKHGKPSKDEENVDVLKRVEDSAAEWILNEYEKHGIKLFKIFGLLRVRYKESEKGNSPGYTRGSVAWLCKEHVHEGLKAGILESYPVKFYNPELN